MSDSVTIGGRTYRFYEDGAVGAKHGTLVRIHDEATPFLAHLARTLPDEFNRALRHVGWHLRGQIREGIMNEAPGGRRWPALSDIQRYRLLDDLRGRHKLFSTKTRRQLGWKNLKARKRAYGRLVMAVGYRHEPGKMRVQVGWLSSAAAARAMELQAGGQTPITARMRRFYWAAGIPLGADKIHFKTPPRPVMRPVFEAERGQIGPRIERRIQGYLRGAEAKARRSA